MPQNTPNSTLEKIVSSEVFEALRFLWVRQSKKVVCDSFFVTEKEFSLLESIYSETDINDTTKKFSLLITSEFEALLSGFKTANNTYYRINITFDCQEIRKHLCKLSRLEEYDSNIAKYLDIGIESKNNPESESLKQFVREIMNLIKIEGKLESKGYFFYKNQENSESIDETDIISFKLAQKPIIAYLRSKISQNYDLVDVIKSTVDRVRAFLKVDRLVIYQLGISQYFKNSKDPDLNTVDMVTYEALSSPDIKSILYFKNENCLGKYSRYCHKYRQGFSVAIENIRDTDLVNDCLPDFMLRSQVRAKLITPINIRGKLWGLLISHQCFSPREWHSHEIQFLRKIAEHLAIAIGDNESYGSLERQKKLLEKQVENQAQQIKNALVAAKVASETKHEFIGSMSHELKTPLTRVIGLSGTLLHWSSTKNRIPLSLEKQQQYLKIIQDSGKHLLELINNILEFSEVESGKFLLDIQELSLTKVVAEVVISLQKKADDKCISLIREIQLQPQQDKFYGDNLRLKEILFNLIDNGIKFTPSEGEVRIGIWQEEKKVIIEVEDTGIGISQEQLPLLFQSFQQLENYRQRTQGGTGLGLALTKHLVELHGGNIEVESSLGRGSLFRVYLPNKVKLSKPNYNKVKLSKPNYNYDLRKNIVLITDNNEIATFICGLFTSKGHKVIWLTDDITALERVELLQPEILILDNENLEFPIHRIIDIFQKINKQKLNKVLLLCSQMLKERWKFLATNGVSDYWIKSSNFDEIASKLNNLIDR